MNVDQIIDKRTIAVPGPIGQVTPQVQTLHDETKTWRDQTEAFAGSTVALQDQAVSALLLDPSSASRDAMDYAGRKTMVVFGDSMTTAPDVDGQRWHEVLAGMLGLNDKNYGHGGSGFINVSNGVAYSDEVEWAAQDTSVDRTKVRYVFINGSTNDWYAISDYAAYAAQVDSILSRIRTLYPNALLVGMSGLCFGSVRYSTNGVSSDVRFQDMTRMFRTAGQRMRANGYATLDSHLWFAYRFDLTMGDDLHPNADGCRLLANILRAFLTTGVTPPYGPINSPVAAQERYPSGISAATLDQYLPVSTNYYNYTINPARNTAELAINTTASLDYAHTIQFGINRKNDNTQLYGIDIPLLVKMWPLRVTDSITMRTTPCTAWFGGVAAAASLDYGRVSDGRLATPGDAKRFIWLRVESCPNPNYYQSPTQPVIYNLMDNVDPSNAKMTNKVKVQTTLSVPLETEYI